MATIIPRTERHRRYTIYLSALTFVFEGLNHKVTLGSFAPIDPVTLGPLDVCDMRFDWEASLKVVDVEVERPSLLLQGPGLLVVDGNPLPMTAQQVLKAGFDRIPGFSVVASESTHGG